MKRRLIILARLICFLICLNMAFFIGFRWKYRHVLSALAETHVKNATADLLNLALDHQIAEGKIAYDRIVYFEKDLDGRITALKTNIGEVNRLKTEMLKTVNREILDLNTSDLGIPMGSLFLPEFFSGKGPSIPVHILSIRNSDAEFSSEFTQAGINQTLHRLIMTVKVDMSVLVLGESHSFSLKTEVIVAETVIIGDVPQTYLQTGELYESTRKNP